MILYCQLLIHFYLILVYNINQRGGHMEKKESLKFPKGFFTQHRPTISMKEALKDVIPFRWSENVLKGKSKVKIVSKKNNS